MWIVAFASLCGLPAFADEIHSAAADGETRKVCALLDENAARVHAKDSYGNTPLHWAARRGFKEIVQALLDRKADVNARDGHDATPLHWAARHGYGDLCEYFLSQNADLLARDKDGKTAFDWAEAAGKGAALQTITEKRLQTLISNRDWKRLAELLKARPELSASQLPQTGRNVTLLHIAAGERREGAAALFDALFALKLDVNPRDNHDATPLHYAAYQGNKRLVELLVAQKADVNALDDAGRTPLHYAAGYVRQEIVLLLVAAKADVNLQDREGYTPMLHALRAAYSVYGGESMNAPFGGGTGWSSGPEQVAQVVKTLLENRADANLADKAGVTPLALARDKGLPIVAQLLRDHSAKPDRGLFEAAALGDEVGLSALLKEHPDWLDRKDAVGHSPLHVAIVCEKKSAVELLLAAKADHRAQDHHGWSPLHLAVMKAQIECVELLLTHGADTAARDNRGDTVLISACGQAASKTPKVVELLLARGADPRAANRSGETPLHRAAAYGNIEALKLLIARGVDMHARGASGMTALHCAMNGPREEVGEFLLENGADPNIVADHAGTPLHQAVMIAAMNSRGEYQAHIVHLLSHKADLTIRNKQGKTPIDIATERGNTHLAELLGKYGTPEWKPVAARHEIFFAARKGNLPKLKELLAADSTLATCQNHEGSTPLHAAAQYGQVAVAEVLLENKANVDAKNNHGYRPLQLTLVPEMIALLRKHGASGGPQRARPRVPRNEELLLAVSAAAAEKVAAILKASPESANALQDYSNQWSMLHEAAAEGHAEIAGLLLAHNAEVNVVNKDGETPLHWAARNGHVAVAEALLKSKANPNAPEDNKDRTPLHWAVFYGREEVVALLLNAKADSSAKDRAGKTALFYALDDNREGIVELLRKAGAKE